jgi:ketosteroid isomerase-like protein
MAQSNIDPAVFAEQWLAAWNARDIEAILAHFHEDAVFTSPLAAQIDPGSDGVVRGKAAIRSYWSTAMDRNHRLHFDITSLFAGVDCVLIGFRNDRDEDRFEVLRLRDGRVFEGHGTYRVAFQNDDA